MDCMRNHFLDGVLLNGRYKTVCPLNHGSFGLVFKAQDVILNQTVALKCLTKPTANTSGQANFAIDEKSEELVIHRLIGTHDNVVNLLDHFETPNHVYLVLEFCENGDLYEAIRVGRGPGQTENIRDAMLQLISAVEFMHSCGVYHRDIKPENIFLSESGVIKLGDFGLATRDAISNEAAVGSDRYMAPEQMDLPEGGYVPAKADVWAIGICLLNILFSRNPFAAPVLSDPLFADFASDRQTLFDIFPNMSQDTFNVLIHCLAIEPENRSLSKARDAIEQAISFTTDDETLDEFCCAPAVPATANREPLRTPSISSPQIDQDGAFPWAKALAMSSPVRQLSVIQDTELSDRLFSDNEPYAAYKSQPDNASMVSFVDSGLGVSVKSSNLSVEATGSTKSKPVPISGSLPASAARPIPSMAMVFGKKGEFQSKSWSDIWDEDFEEENAMAARANNDSGFFRQDSLDSLASASNGSNTPRVGLSEVKKPDVVNNARVTPTKVKKIDEAVSEHTGFLFEEHQMTPLAVQAPPPAVQTPPAFLPTVGKYSPPSKRSILDKWSALGDKRRGQTTPAKPESKAMTALASTLALTPSTKRPRPEPSRKGLNWNLWGQGHRNWNNSTGTLSHDGKRDWNKSKDWRLIEKSTTTKHTEPNKGRPLEWVWRM